MSTRPRLLRLALLGDAAASAGMGVLLAAAAGPLGDLLGLPAPLLRWAGLVLLPYAALVAWLGAHPAPSRPLVCAAIAVNLLWALDSVVLLLSGLVAPRPLGTVFVLGQAAIVLGFAAAQWVAIRRGNSAPALA